MQTLTAEEIDTIATTAAARYVNKGIRSYPFEDMYQDAAVQALHAQGLWKADKGVDLVRYCYIAAERELRHKITRAISPVSARGHDQTTRLGKTTRHVDFRYESDPGLKEAGYSGVPVPSYDGATNLEACQIRAVVRRQCARVLGDDVDALRVLPALCGLCDPRDLVEDDFPINRVRASLQRAKRKLANDLTLWKTANQ